MIGIFCAALCCAGFLFIGYVVKDPRLPLENPDSLLYLSVADALRQAQVRWLPSTAEIAAHYQLGAVYARGLITPLIGSLIAAISSPQAFPSAIVDFNLCLVASVIPLVYATAKRSADLPAACLAGLLFLLLWDPLVSVQTFLTEPFAIFGVALAALLLSLAKVRGRRGFVASVSAGVVVAALCMNHGSIIVILVVITSVSLIVVALAAGRLEIRQRMGVLAFGSLAFCIAMTPFFLGEAASGLYSGQGGIGLGGGSAWTLYVNWVSRDNRSVTWVPTPADYVLVESYSGAEKVDDIAARIRNGTLEIDDCLLREIEPIFGLGGKAEMISDQMYRRAALCNIWQNRSEIIPLFLRKVYVYLANGGPPISKFVLRTGFEPLDTLFARYDDETRSWRYVVVFVCAMAGAALALIRRRPILIVFGVAVVVHTGLMVIAAPPEVRYKLPITPLMCLLAAYGVTSTFSSAKRGFSKTS